MSDESPRLSANIVASVGNVVAVVGASLVAVPLIVDRLGLAGYGLWVLAQSIVIYITTAELGFGPAISRFTGVHAADADAVRRLLVLTMSVYAVVGLLLTALLWVVARPLVDLFDVPARFDHDALRTVRLMGVVATAALVASGLGHLLNGRERFLAATVTNAVGSLVFLVTLVALLDRGRRIEDAAWATLAQWVVVAALRLVVLRDVLRAGRGLLPDRRLIRELAAFAARLQAATLATLLSTQTDRVIVGVVAPATTLGQVGLATQVGDAGRLVGYSVFTPLATRMAVTYGEGGEPAVRRTLAGLRAGWMTATFGAVVVAVGAVRPTIESWVGPGHDQAALFAGLLITGYGTGLLPSPDFAYLRALGRPSTEGLFGVVTVAGNLAATVLFGILFGAIGVVASTTGAYLASTAWVLLRLRREIPADARPRPPLARVLGAAAVAGGLAYLLGQAAIVAVPGVLALPLIGLAVAACLSLYATLTLGAGPLIVARIRRS